MCQKRGGNCAKSVRFCCLHKTSMSADPLGIPDAITSDALRQGQAEEDTMHSTYKFTCNLLVEPPKVDRFYMDMRVYSVVPAEKPMETSAKGSLVWRGIYLAYQDGTAKNKS